MKKIKYKILRTVHDSLPTKPLGRGYFYKNTKKINRYKQAIDELIDSRAITQEPGSDKLKLGQNGVSVLEQEEDRRDMIKRYWITTAISILALAVSVIALLSQLGILQLPECR